MKPFSSLSEATSTPSPHKSFAANSAEKTLDSSFPPAKGRTCKISVVPPPISNSCMVLHTYVCHLFGGCNMEQRFQVQI